LNLGTGEAEAFWFGGIVNARRSGLRQLALNLGAIFLGRPAETGDGVLGCGNGVPSSSSAKAYAGDRLTVGRLGDVHDLAPAGFDERGGSSTGSGSPAGNRVFWMRIAATRSGARHSFAARLLPGFGLAAKGVE